VVQPKGARHTSKPLLGLSTFFSPGSFSMGQTFYARPRRSLQVKKEDNPC